jgi:hypothetical protein
MAFRIGWWTCFCSGVSLPALQGSLITVLCSELSISL